MGKVRTSYDTLLRVRRIEEDRAKAALAAANHVRREAQGELEGRRAHYRQETTRPDGETALDDFRRHQGHLTSLARAVTHAAGEVEKADTAREQAVLGARQAAMRTQGLERLVERAVEARQAQVLAADQRTAEESRAGKRPARAKGAR